MSQTLAPASPAQRSFIADLVSDLHIRNIDPWADDLTGTEAGRILDRLQLRQISQRLNRPVTVDLNNPDVVKRELDRVRQLDAARGGNSRRSNSHLTKVLKADYDDVSPVTAQAIKRRALARAGVTVRQVAPQPRTTLTIQQERARRGSLDRGQIGPYATGRYSESFGYGGAATRVIQDADARTMGAEPLLREDKPTEPMAKYLSDLQKKAGEKQVPAIDRADCSTEIDRLKAKLGL